MPSRSDLLENVRARAGLLAAAGVVASVLTGSLLARPPGGEGPSVFVGWNLLGVRVSMWPPFADLRNVTHRWACVRAGIDSYADGRCDPWGRLFNYPSPWLWPAGWGWTGRLTVPLGFGEIALFFAALWALFPARDGRTAVATALLVLTPPVMFVVERGNVDMLVFAAVTAAFVGTRRAPEAVRGAVRLLTLTALGFLKLYPLAAFAYAARTPRRAALAVAGAALAALSIWAAYGPVLRVMAANSGEAVDDSYGRLIPFLLAAPALRGWSAPLAAVLLALGAGIGFIAARRITAGLGVLLDTETSPQLAAVGTAIYLSTWMIGSSYDYRLIFLLLLFPLLIETDAGRWRSPALALGVLVYGRLALAHRIPFGAAAAYDVVLVPVLAAWAAASARLRLWPAADRA